MLWICVFPTGQAGSVIQKILESNKFEITAIQMFHMEQANAEEFFEVYKGVVQEYSSMVNQLTSGPCIAMEIRDTQGHSTPESFREFTGPADPVRSDAYISYIIA